MHRCAFAYKVCGVVAASFVLIPISPSLAASLREEAVAYRTEGYKAQHRGDSVSALAFYQKAAALDQSYPTPHNDIGIVLEEQGRLEEAEKSYQKALAIDSNHLEAHANLAMLYERIGNNEQAIYHWLKRYQLGDPYDEWTARAEERLAALGFLTTYPGLKGSLYTRRHVISQEFQSHAKTLKEYRSLTEEHGDWP